MDGELGEVAVILFFYVTFLLTFSRKRNILGEFLLGIAFGIGWELLTLNMWEYDMPLVLFEDLSILLILGWGVVFVLTIHTSEYLQKQGVKAIPADLISAAWGIGFEWFGHVYFNYWDYNDVYAGPTFAGIPWMIFIAWFGLVMLFNHFIRNYDTIIEARLKRLKVS
jgi:hypothetical protein